MIAGDKTHGYYVLEMSNHTGHYQVDVSSVTIAKDKFKKAINIQNNFTITDATK